MYLQDTSSTVDDIEFVESATSYATLGDFKLGLWYILTIGVWADGFVFARDQDCRRDSVASRPLFPGGLSS